MEKFNKIIPNYSEINNNMGNGSTGSKISISVTIYKIQNQKEEKTKISLKEHEKKTRSKVTEEIKEKFNPFETVYKTNPGVRKSKSIESSVF